MRKVTPPAIKRIPLVDWDPSGETWVELREPRFAASMQRERRLLPKLLERLLPDGVIEREMSEPGANETMALQIWLTFAGAHIVAEDDTLPFTAELSEAEFYAALLRQDPQLVAAWHAAVLDFVPDWRD